MAPNKISNQPSFIESLIDVAINQKIKELEKEIENLKAGKKKRRDASINSQGTARQVTQTIRYLHNSEWMPNLSGTNTTDAEFIRFLTGKDIDSIRKNLMDPKKLKRNESTGKATKDLIDDLKIIRSYFEKILFTEGIVKINKDLEIFENDLISF